MSFNSAELEILECALIEFAKLTNPDDARSASDIDALTRKVREAAKVAPDAAVIGRASCPICGTEMTYTGWKNDPGEEE